MNVPFAWITLAALIGWLESDKDPRTVTLLSSEGELNARVGLFLEPVLSPLPEMPPDAVAVDIDVVERPGGCFNIRKWASHGPLQTGTYRLYNQKLEPEEEKITVQEAWLAAGGNEGIKATRKELFDALKSMDEAVDECDEKHGLHSDTERLDFSIERNTTWYPGRASNGRGILCFDFNDNRAEVTGLTMREAIDTAIEETTA